MAKNQCIMFPEVNGEDSKLYKDLLSRINNRPLTNFIYACYLQKGVAEQMNNAGFKVNKQGQHNAREVMQFFDTASMQKDIGKMFDTALQIGSKDANGDFIDYNNAKEALEKANQANNTMKGVVAFVVQKGDVFNIYTVPKDSRSFMKVKDTQDSLTAWNILEQVFNSKNIDINSLDFYKELINANNTGQFLEWLRNVRLTRNDLLSAKEVRTLLELDKNSIQVQRLETMFGSTEEAANKIYEALHTNGQGYTQSQLDLMNSALNNCKNIQEIDINTVKEQINDAIGSQATNIEYEDIAQTLRELNEKYNIEFNIIEGRAHKIEKLSDVAFAAAFTLKNRLQKLREKEGITQEVKDLQGQINQLLKEIQNKTFYAGTLSFLSDALKQVKVMEDLFKQASLIPGTNMQKNRERAKALQEIKNIKDGYKHIIDSLSYIDNLTIDEVINPNDKQQLQDEARKIKEIFENYDKKIQKLTENTMIDIATSYLGDTDANGQSIANIVTMAESDTSIWEWLYSMSRVSDPLANTVGTIIRDAQEERDKKLVEMSHRIRRITRRLYDAGFSSSFMYDGQYIISDINWEKYKEAKKKARKSLYKQGLRGLTLEESLEKWEERNTEERIVDFTNGRTERVPNSNYRQEFPKLSPEQLRYYNDMMQLKGEIGSLLPDYAQKQYLAPQKRRTFVDAINESKGNPKKIARAIIEKLNSYFIMREDDPINSRNGIIDGNEYGIKTSSLQGSPERRIPIFYINKLKDQGELLHDFSGAMQSLASTAINYDKMNEIKDTVEFMADYIEHREIVEKEGKKTIVDVLNGVGISLMQRLVKHSKHTNTAALVDGFIDAHIYGNKLKSVGIFTQFLNSLLKYTSVRALTTNVKGFFANYLVGKLQQIIEAGAGEFYGFRDLAWAEVKLLGDITTGAPGRIMDFMTNNVNSKAVLLAEIFNPINEVYQELSTERYFKGPLTHLTRKDYTFIGYGIGEFALHYTTMYAVLHNQKVLIDGKKASLYEAFYKTDKEDGTSELKLKDNVTYIDENGVEREVDEAFIDKIKKRIRYCNQTTQGSMNEEDKGLISQYMLGRYVMNLRQWMVEHYSRRYRGTHFDSTLGEERTGFYVDAIKFAISWSKALFNFESEYASRWKDLTITQKANCKRAMYEQLLVGLLLGLSFALGEPDEHKKEFWTRMWIYQTKRALMDVRGSTPYGIPMEMNKLINSPISATNTVNAMMYPFIGLGDLDETVKRGRYKGWNKYGRNMLRYWAPHYNQIDQLANMDTDEGSFNFEQVIVK